MPAFVALFRAVNVGGRGIVPMRDLVAMATRLGFEAPRTLLQSGNLVFSTSTSDPDVLERRLETAAKAELDLDTRVLVRSAAAWADLVVSNPYSDFARSDPSHLVVMPLRAIPTAKATVALRAAILGRETVATNGTTLYLTYPEGIGRSKLTSAVIERCLGTVGTARNWNTVLRIAAALAG